MQPTTSTPLPPAPRGRQSLSLDLRWVVIFLLLVIAAMLFLWKPWDNFGTNASGASAKDRTVKVTGEATLKAEPDEFVFYPTYSAKNTDRTAALAEIAAKSSELTTKLKELGVKDGQIKTNTSGYSQEQPAIYPPAPGKPEDGTSSYNLQLTVTVANKTMAQKVQDYLATTAPTGAVTPSSSFSEAKRKELESKARDEASKDARAKADQSARNLGFRVGSVKTVSDGSGFGGIVPGQERAVADSVMSVAPSKLNVQPGENELRYTVSVEYFVR